MLFQKATFRLLFGERLVREASKGVVPAMGAGESGGLPYGERVMDGFSLKEGSPHDPRWGGGRLTLEG